MLLAFGRFLPAHVFSKSSWARLCLPQRWEEIHANWMRPGFPLQPRHRSVSRCEMSRSPTESWIMILTWHLYATASTKTCHSHKMISFWISNDFNFSLHLCHSFTFQWRHLKKQNTTLVHRSAMCCYTCHQVLAYEALVARLQSELRWEKERRQSCDQAIRMRRSWTCEIFSWSVNRQVTKYIIDSLLVQIGN